MQLALLGGGVTIGGMFWISRREKIPYAQRMHAIFISTRTERQLGKNLFEHVKKQALMQKTLLPASHYYSKLVRNIGTRIAEVASQPLDDGMWYHMKNLDWEFVVVNSDVINAFVLPGGKVVVYTGLINAMETVDEVAAVLAHEVAHVLARHSAERITEVGIMAVIQFLIAAVIGIPVPEGMITVLFSLPHSRRAETEADVIGVRLMARACFDPSAAPSMLHRLDVMEKQHQLVTSKGPEPPLMRTHPVTADRVERVKEELPVAVDLFRQSECQTQRTLTQSILQLVGVTK